MVPDRPCSTEDKVWKSQKEQTSYFTGRAKCLASHLPCSVEGENKMEEEGSQFSPCAIGQTRWTSLLPLCSPPSSHPGPGEPLVVVCSWVALNKLCWKQLFGHQLYLRGHFYQHNSPRRMWVFSPRSRTRLAVPSCHWLDLSLEWEIVQPILLTLKNIK